MMVVEMSNLYQDKLPQSLIRTSWGVIRRSDELNMNLSECHKSSLPILSDSIISVSKIITEKLFKDRILIFNIDEAMPQEKFHRDFARTIFNLFGKTFDNKLFISLSLMCHLDDENTKNIVLSMIVFSMCAKLSFQLVSVTGDDFFMISINENGIFWDGIEIPSEI
jgi:hypothetical protein